MSGVLRGDEVGKGGGVEGGRVGMQTYWGKVIGLT